MSNLKLRGILAAVTTPFTADASAVDEDNIRQQVERLVAAGIHGLVPTGSTGEFSSLTPEEHRRVIEVYVEAAAGRVPVIAGVGTLTTQGTVELAQFAEKAGADAVMVVPPFYDPPHCAFISKVEVTMATARQTIPDGYVHTRDCLTPVLTAAWKRMT